jgi:hypothetical protein
VDKILALPKLFSALITIPNALVILPFASLFCLPKRKLTPGLSEFIIKIMSVKMLDLL